MTKSVNPDLSLIYSCESFRSRQSSRNVLRQELSWLLVQEFNLNPSHATHDEPDDLGDRHIDRADIKNYVGQEHFEIALCLDTESIVAGFENNPISNWVTLSLRCRQCGYSQTFIVDVLSVRLWGSE